MRRERRRGRRPRLARCLRREDRRRARGASTRSPGRASLGTRPGAATAGRPAAASTWVTGSYDPALNLIYWGVGNPAPDWNGDVRLGDNLYTCSLIALDAKTGTLRWHFQFTPHDTHDWDATQVPVLRRRRRCAGRTRKLVVTANRNGFYYVLDRTTGEFLKGTAYAKQTWARGLDASGRPLVMPGTEPSTTGTLVWPSLEGATNWFSPSYSPATGASCTSRSARWGRATSRATRQYKPGKRFMGGGEVVEAPARSVGRGARARPAHRRAALGAPAALAALGWRDGDRRRARVRQHQRGRRLCARSRDGAAALELPDGWPVQRPTRSRSRSTAGSTSPPQQRSRVRLRAPLMASLGYISRMPDAPRVTRRRFIDTLASVPVAAAVPGRAPERRPYLGLGVAAMAGGAHAAAGIRRAGTTRGSAAKRRSGACRSRLEFRARAHTVDADGPFGERPLPRVLPERPIRVARRLHDPGPRVHPRRLRLPSGTGRPGSGDRRPLRRTGLHPREGRVLHDAALPRPGLRPHPEGPHGPGAGDRRSALARRACSCSARRRSSTSGATTRR